MYDGRGVWITCVARMHYERYAFRPVVSQNYVFVAGGFRRVAVTSIESYNGKTWTVSPSPYSLDIPRMGGVLTDIDGVLFIAGGHADVTIAKCGDVSKDGCCWSFITKISSACPRRNATVAVDNGTFYVLGGFERGGNLSAKSVKISSVDCYSIHKKNMVSTS